MKLIVGLGNPGSKYEKTRHNVGFRVIEQFANKHGLSFKSNKFQSHGFEYKKTLFIKPQTFMNLSGESVLAAASFYHIEPEDIIVIYDDLDLPVGDLRIRKNGGAGGHKGMSSIISLLHTQNIPRIRIGIGKDDSPVEHYVLSSPPKKEDPLYQKAFDMAIIALEAYLEGHSLEVLMNEFQISDAPQ
jgi:peptidyl-tRNA hydrolase, PTH1 family